MDGLLWFDTEEALDWLRVGSDNADIVEGLASTIPAYVEAVTGYDASLCAGRGCNEVAKQLCRFVLQLWYNPDGTDAAQLTRVVDSLTKTVKAMVVAGVLEESAE